MSSFYASIRFIGFFLFCTATIIPANASESFSEPEKRPDFFTDCNCIAPTTGQLVLCENFQSYEPGPISPQSSRWFPWPGANRDGIVAQSDANRYLHLKHDNGAESDVLLDLGNRTSGKYQLSWRLWTWKGTSGYFNLQHTNTIQKNSDANWAYHVLLQNGEGLLRVGSFSSPALSASFPYTANAWTYIVQIIDLDKDEIQLLVNDQEVASWKFSIGARGASKRLGAIDFFAEADYNCNFAVDNICLVKLEDTPPPSPEKPNLTCISPGNARIVGTKLSIEGLRVKNNGKGPSQSGKLGFFLSKNTDFTTKDYLIGERDVPALSAGEEAFIHFSMDLRSADVPDDVYYLGFIIDYPDAIEETNENDNNDCYYAGFVIKYITENKKPNLVCADRGKLTITNKFLSIQGLKVGNVGSGKAGASRVGIYLSQNTNFTINDLLIGELEIPALSPGAEAGAGIKIPVEELLDLPAGDYFVGFIVDHRNDVEESSGTDNNNCYWTDQKLSLPLITPLPNLNCLGGGRLRVKGQRISIRNVVITNDGQRGSGPFQVGYYLSTDQTFNTDDLLVAEDSLNNLGAADSWTINTLLSLEELELAPGTYYLGILLDHRSKVEESDETDNAGCSWSKPTIEINPPPPPSCVCTDLTQEYICDDFETYSTGYIGPQSDCFSTWSGKEGGKTDGLVVTEQVYAGKQALGLFENGKPNLLLYLGERQAGTYALEWMMYIPKGKSARYTLQESHRPNVATKLQVNFGEHTPGIGYIKESETTFSYPQGEWFKIRQVVNLDMNHLKLYINDELIAEDIPFLFGLGAVQLTKINSKTEFYIDDFVFDLLFIVIDGEVQPMYLETEYPMVEEAEPALRVFPNPTSVEASIHLANPQEAPIRIDLIDRLGRLLWTKEFGSLSRLQEGIPLHGMPPGIYFVRAQLGEQLLFQRLVVY